VSDTFLPVNSFAQFALPSVLSAIPDFYPAYARELIQLKELLLISLGSIPGFQLLVPEGGFTVVVELDSQIYAIDEEEFAVRLLVEKGVHVYPGYFFDFPGNGRFVISFQNFPNVLTEGLSRIQEFAAELRGE